MVLVLIWEERCQLSREEIGVSEHSLLALEGMSALQLNVAPVKTSIVCRGSHSKSNHTDGNHTDGQPY
jgi:hypothetical protein